MIYSYFIQDDLDILTREEYESALVSTAPNIAPEEKDAMPTTVSKCSITKFLISAIKMTSFKNQEC